MTASFFYPSCCGIVTAARRAGDILSSQSRKDQAKDAAGGSLIERLPAWTWSEGNRSSRARIPQEPRATVFNNVTVIATISHKARREDGVSLVSDDRTKNPVQRGGASCAKRCRSRRPSLPRQDPRARAADLEAMPRPCSEVPSSNARTVYTGAVVGKEQPHGMKPETGFPKGDHRKRSFQSTRESQRPACRRLRSRVQSARHQRVLSPHRSSTRTSVPGTSYAVARRGLRASYVLGRAAVSISSTAQELI